MDGKTIYMAPRPVGRDGADKRIDTIGVAMRLGGGVEDLENLELAYAPLFFRQRIP